MGKQKSMDGESSKEDKRVDDVLKRMLNTPPPPKKEKKIKKGDK